MMRRAIQAAKSSVNEVCVGAVIIKDGEVISCACNKKELTNDVTAHAEITAIREAAQKLGNWRLEGCEMYVTLEPCPMCAWAIINSRIDKVYFGSYDVKYGALGSAVDLRKLACSKLQVYGGIMEEECNELLKECFKELR